MMCMGLRTGFKVTKVNSSPFSSLLSIWGLCDDAGKQTEHDGSGVSAKAGQHGFFTPWRRVAETKTHQEADTLVSRTLLQCVVVHVRVNVCMHTCICTLLYMCICMHVCMHAHVYACVYVYMYVLCACA